MPTDLFYRRSIFPHPIRLLALSSCSFYFFKLALERLTTEHSRKPQSLQFYLASTASSALWLSASASSMARCKSPCFLLNLLLSAPHFLQLTVILSRSGFKFALVPHHIISYAIVIILVLIIIVVSTFIHNRRRRRKAVFETPAAQNFQSAYVAPEYQNDIPLANTGVPPAYSRAMGP